MLGVFLDEATVSRGDIDFTRLKACLDTWQLFEHTPPGHVAERISEAQVVVTNKVYVGEAHLSQAPSLKLVCVAATGTNNIDIPACRERGITVCNVRRYATPSVVQHVFSLILSLVVHLPDYQRLVHGGRWQQSDQFCLLDYPIMELSGKTLGILGYGELGQAVAEAARAFGMNVLIAARRSGPAPQGRVELDELLQGADVLSLHCPLTPETKGLIGERELDLMKDRAILINTARGGIVDERALAKALRERRIGAAGVDVLTVEPPAQGNPLLDPEIPNLIVTPHIAWASRESRQRLIDDVAENIAAYLAGAPRNVVEV